jgi:class 3 adenylate cyclase
MLIPVVLVFVIMSNTSGEGYRSDYYVGVIYCLVVMVLFPFPTRTLIVLQLAMYATYTLGMEFVFPVATERRYVVENHMFMLGIGVIVTCSHYYISSLRRRIEIANHKNEELLLNILPEKVVSELRESRSASPERFRRVSVLFADIVDFTPLAARIGASNLVAILNDVFSRFDELAKQHGCERIKTIGDAYMAACGAPQPNERCTHAIACMALDMKRCIKEVYREGGDSFSLRIGINEGEAIAGIVGHTKFSYDLWGDSVNLASRMEAHPSHAGCLRQPEGRFSTRRARAC